MLGSSSASQKSKNSKKIYIMGLKPLETHTFIIDSRFQLLVFSLAFSYEFSHLFGNAGQLEPVVARITTKSVSKDSGKLESSYLPLTSPPIKLSFA